MSLLFRYSLFAVIATLSNLLSQDLVVGLIPHSTGLILSILCGTVTGLVVKYWLDKHYIFNVVTRDMKQDGQIFLLYTLMGILTTFIFWGTELAFHFYFETREMRYAGAVLGLTIGYYIKYQLDKRFVFSLVKSGSHSPKN